MWVPFDAAGGPAGLAGAFDAEHNRLYGFSLDHHAREFVDLRVAAVGVNAEADQLTPTRVPQGGADGAEAQFWDGRAMRFEAGRVFDRDGLAPGWRATGPLAIVGVDAVVWVPARVPALVDPAGNLELDVGSVL
jgi:N-methylhydantoinase A